MRKEFFVAMVTLLPIANTLGQHTLNKEYNLFRAEDYLYKQQIEFMPPGDKGENINWDISQLKVIDEQYKVSYMEYPDSILIAREGRTLHKYALKQDTLFSTGIENQTTLVELYRPKLQLVFPVSYGDKQDGFFHGTGNYCNQFDLILSGKTMYHADAYGTLQLPEGETLEEVVRIHHTKYQLEDQYIHYSFSVLDTIYSPEKIAWRLENDTLWSRTETYRWYVAGYRYPVFETIEHFIHQNGKETLNAATAFYYPPHEQYYGLENDPENTQKREMALAAKEKRDQNKQKEKDQTERKNPFPENDLFSYQLHMEEDYSILHINYYLSNPSEISFLLIDVQGRILMRHPKTPKENGSWQESIPMYDYPKGEYLLHIITDEKTYTEKITR